MVAEVVGDGDVTVLRCVKCGATASLTDADGLKSMHCKAGDTGSVNGRCAGCGKKGKTETYPNYDPVTEILKTIDLCEGCGKDWMNILRRSGPMIGRQRGRAPPNSYWFPPYNTYFTEIAGTYPCPACEEFYESFYEVVKHFGEKHVDRTKASEKTVVNGLETVRTWQGILCPYCGRIYDNENHLRYHLRRDHG